jgi:hypothetical protein
MNNNNNDIIIYNPRNNNPRNNNPRNNNPPQIIYILRNIGSNYILSQNNPRTDTLSITRNINGEAKIKIPSKLLKPKNNSANISCQNFIDLYNEIMRINLPEEFKFKFEGQAGSDFGGLTRDIFEKLLPVYTHRFFESVESNNEFMILKKFKDMPQPPQEQVENKKKNEIADIISQILQRETKQMVHLARKAGTKIFLRIKPSLLALLQSKNYMEYFNNNNKKYFKNLYKFLNKEISKLNERDNISNYFINYPSEHFKNKESINTLLVEGQFMQLNNSIKREIRLRKFAKDCGFTTWEQLNNMYSFIQQFWDPEYFTSELKFDIESFVKKLKLNINEKNLPLEVFGELSEDKKNFVFKKINYITNIIFTKYVFLLPFLNYIIGPESTDEIRKKTIAYIAGSSYYPGELKLNLSHQSAPYPFKAASCLHELNFYKYNSETQIQINNKNRFIKSELEPREGTQNFGLV